MSRLCDIRAGDEVLVRIDEGKFYFGIIKDVRNESALARFDDGTEQWAQADELTKFSANNESSLCVVCKEYDGIVHICSQCQRGFHKKCIKLSKRDDCTVNWLCHKCSTSSDTNEASVPARSVSVKRAKIPDSCYCGEKDDWFMQMLQCARCLQWFHSKCIKCLNFPLYFGDRYDKSVLANFLLYLLLNVIDSFLKHSPHFKTFYRFYLFACARCNHGTEFLRRLHMNIEEVVHLLLFNLTLQFRKRYYNLTNVIYPYSRDNWHALQLPPKVSSIENLLCDCVRISIVCLCSN